MPNDATQQDYDFNKSPKMKEYLQKRFHPQLEWYEKHAKSSMYKFYSCQVVVVFFGAIIPFINALSPDTYAYAVRVLSSFFGGTIIVATSLLQLTKAYENWINYRSTAEQLKQEYQLFALEAGKYSDEELGMKIPNKDLKERFFVNNVELLVELEGKKFLSTMLKRSSE